MISKDKTLERLSNAAVIAVAVVVLITFVKHEWFNPVSSPASSYSKVFLGKTIQVADITSSPAKLNIVLGLSTTCHFCTQNSPLYRTLSLLRQPGQVALFAIFPETQAEARTYLTQKDIQPDGIVSSPLSRFGISGTPTLLLMDSGGKVKRAWIGALDQTSQDEVVHEIQNTPQVRSSLPPQ